MPLPSISREDGWFCLQNSHDHATKSTARLCGDAQGVKQNAQSNQPPRNAPSRRAGKTPQKQRSIRNPNRLPMMALELLYFKAEIIPLPGSPQEATVLHNNLPIQTLTAADVMTEHVLALPPDIPLHEAAHQLRSAFVTGAPVVDYRGQCIGVLSATYFLRYEDSEAALRGPHSQMCFHSDWPMPDWDCNAPRSGPPPHAHRRGSGPP